MTKKHLEANKAVPAGGVTVVGVRHGLELAIKPGQAKGLGKIITRPDSPDLIADVMIEPVQVHPDDRGFFAELARLGSGGIAARMIADGRRQVQVSMTLTYPGTIKAIHYHYEQTDLWAPVSGTLQVFLYDLRRNSKTFGRTNTVYIGVHRVWEILIPPGVGHGYKVLGTGPAQLVYLTDRHYNPEDEGRLAYDHPEIAYDWEIQHK
ncbi:MAG TPA: dTDP-4-dehydrorhamnose 3,5-epimerase family protein [Verrucomicrobiae bacterium]|jgi:dTDP-4-dehydrorhamnose 3,5-epimerase|nr:dTDP-4-dehydrorhamnose 3,5-epimerase family protein [Verrucomicrobiae bacterium]